MVLYDDARRRVRAVGAHNVPLERLAGRHVGLEDAPVGRTALAEDRVVQAPGNLGGRVAPEFSDLVEGSSLVVVPIVAAGPLDRDHPRRPRLRQAAGRRSP